MGEERVCKSEKSVLKRWIITTTISLILLISLIIVVMNIEFYDKPKVDETAKEGVPEVEEQYEYSTLTINDGYEIGLCGKPKFEDEKIELYITNLENNEVWLKAQILNEKEEVIGETGLILPNQYVKDIQLKEKVEGTIKVKIVEYEIDTYNSKGSVNLNI